MKKLLCLFSMLCAFAGTAQESTLKRPTVTLRPGPAGSDVSALVQSTVDHFPQVTDIFSGYGGGKIIFEAGSYTFTTNIVFPNYFPWNIEMEGAGSGFGANTLFVLKSTHQDVTKGYFVGATNQILNLTNTLMSDIHGIMFAQEAMLSTNFILDLKGATLTKIHDNTFTTMYGLTNGQGAYSLNWEANVPNQPIGCCGVAVNVAYNAQYQGSTANTELWCDRNVFFCLANGLASGAVINRITFNSFADVGMYNSTAPPVDDHSTIHWATNLWTGDIGGAPTPLCAGFAVSTIGGGDSGIIAFNEFYGCGITFVPNASNNRYFENRLSVCGYRIAEDPDISSPMAVVVSATEPSSGGISGTIPFDDVALTNSVNGLWLQPDGGHSGSNVRARTAPTGIPLIRMAYGTGSAGQYHGFSGGPVISTNGFFYGANAGPLNTNFTAYAAGTAYTLTGTSAALDFGTTDPVLTINQAGTYLIQGNVDMFYVGATYAATNHATFKFRRTNNTAADLSNSTRLVPIPVQTTVTADAGVIALPPVIYTATSGDTITIFGNVRTTPGAGAVETDSAEIVAVRLY